MTLTVHRVSESVSVAGQLAPESMAEAAAAGFRSVINNRPDFEGGPTQPTSARLEAAARAAGLEYSFLPVAGNFQSAAEIAVSRAHALHAEPRARVLPLRRAVGPAVSSGVVAGLGISRFGA